MKRQSRPIRLLVLWSLVAALVVVGLVAQVRPALAHAAFERAEPAPDSALEEAPARVTIWFTEPVEPEFSQIQVLDAAGEPVDNEDSQVDAADAHALAVSLPPLPPGSYTVAWRNVSSVDGHPMSGTFRFSVGTETAAATTEPAGELATGSVASPAEPILRWLALASILAIAGGLTFDLFVVRPALKQQASGPVQQLDRALSRRLFRFVQVALALFVAASAGWLLLQAATIHVVSLNELSWPLLAAVLRGTEWGQLWLWRMGLLLALAAVLHLPRREGTGISGGAVRGVLALAIGGGILLTMALISHAAATSGIRTEAVFSEFVHVLATAFWVGGLFHFALGMPLVMRHLPDEQRRPFLATLVPNFSAVAALSVGALIITGLYLAWSQVTIVPALLTPYGRALLVKIALIAPLLLIGAYNLLWLSPRLATAARGGRHLRRSVTAEALLALLVLLAVAVMASLEPARQAASRQGLSTVGRLLFEDTAEGANITLTVEPGSTGANRLLVTLSDRFGEPISNATDVSVTLTYLEADVAPLTQQATPVEPGTYAIDGVPLSLAGAWQADLLVVRPDAFDARTSFDLEVGQAATTAGQAVTPEPEVGRLLWGVELVLLGLLFVGVSLALGGWRNRRGVMVMGPGVIGFLAGVLLLLTVA